MISRTYKFELAGMQLILEDLPEMKVYLQETADGIRKKFRKKYEIVGYLWLSI